jgi:hypothetical protein
VKALSRQRWLRIRTDNVLGRVMREIRRRTRVVGSFPDGHSVLMLGTARLSFWTTGYCVSTFGLDEETIRRYVREQELLESGQGERI